MIYRRYPAGAFGVADELLDDAAHRFRQHRAYLFLLGGKMLMIPDGLVGAERVKRAEDQ
jgi:hypothetical protein